MTIANLFARIGLKDEASAPLSRFLNTASNTVTAVATVGRAVVDVAREIRAMSKEVLDAAAVYKQFEVETGASAQELQRWQAVAKQTNNSAQSVAQSIKAIAENREKIKLGQGNISGYQLLGIDPNQDPFEILAQLRTQITGLPQAMKKNVLGQLGVSNELLQVLELSNDQFNEMAGRAFIIPSAAINTLDKARGAMSVMGDAITYIKNMIVVGLAPNMEKMSKQFGRFIQTHQKDIVEGFKKAWDIISKFSAAVFNTGRAINEVISNTIGWKSAIYALVGVFALLNASLIASPIGLITAGIIALILVLDDLYGYTQGKDSAIGLLFEQFPGLEEKMKSFVQLIKDIGTLIKSLFTGDDAGISSVLEKWGRWGEAIQFVLDKLKALDEWMKRADYDEKTGNFGNLQGYLKAQGADFKQLITDPKGWATEGLNAFKNVLGLGGTTTNTDINISVNTNGDAAETAEAVRRELERQFNSTQAQRTRNE